MRITGGTYKGRRITCPPGIIRPAMDRMRESLFAILGDLEGRSFLDLFSGSGLMALEAVSRGAYPVTAIERDKGKVGIIRKNLAISDRRIDLHIIPAERYLKRAGRERWDVIFMDPPFAYAHKRQLVQWCAEASLLSAEGVLLIHHPAEELLPAEIRVGDQSQDPASSLTRIDQRKYGGSMVDFFTHRTGE